MAGARHFEELECWQLAREVKLELFAMCERAAVSGDFAFRNQVRDAARSAPRNIAEGFGRRTHRDFAHFLDVARASLMECENHLRDAFDSRYISADERDRLILLVKRATGAVAGLQRYLRSHRD